MHIEDLTGDRNANSSIASPLIIGDVIAFANVREILGFDKYTGEQLWRFPMQESLSLISFLEVNGKVIVKPTNLGATYAIDPATGSLLWKTVDTGRAKNHVTAYSDKLYITSQSGPLMILDVETGAVLGTYYSPYYRQGYADKRPHAIYDANLENAVAIDAVNQIMYTSDGYYLLKCKLPI